jgi:hypothetical protein
MIPIVCDERPGPAKPQTGHGPQKPGVKLGAWGVAVTRDPVTMSEDDDLLADILEGSDVEGESVTSPTHRTPGKVRAHAVSVPESPYGTPQLSAAQAPTLNGSFHTTAGTLYSPVSDNEEETRGRRSGSPEQTSAPAANPLEALGKFVAPPPARVPAPPVAARGPASAVPGVFVPPYMYPGMYGAPVSVPAASAPKPSSTSEFDKVRPGFRHQ